MTRVYKRRAEGATTPKASGKRRADDAFGGGGGEEESPDAAAAAGPSRKKAKLSPSARRKLARELLANDKVREQNRVQQELEQGSPFAAPPAATACPVPINGAASSPQTFFVGTTPRKTTPLRRGGLGGGSSNKKPAASGGSSNKKPAASVRRQRLDLPPRRHEMTLGNESHVPAAGEARSLWPGKFEREAWSTIAPPRRTEVAPTHQSGVPRREFFASPPPAATDTSTHGYRAGQTVLYTSASGDKEVAQVLGVHLDDKHVPYYTVRVGGKEKGTVDSRLSPLESAPRPLTKTKESNVPGRQSFAPPSPAATQKPTRDFREGQTVLYTSANGVDDVAKVIKAHLGDEVETCYTILVGDKEKETVHSRMLPLLRAEREERVNLFMDQVEREFADQPLIVNEVFKITDTLKTRQVDSPDMIRKVSTLLGGNRRLALSFLTYLPEQYKIELPEGDGPVAVVHRAPCGSTNRIVLHMGATDADSRVGTVPNRADVLERPPVARLRATVEGWLVLFRGAILAQRGPVPQGVVAADPDPSAVPDFEETEVEVSGHRLSAKARRVAYPLALALALLSAFGLLLQVGRSPTWNGAATNQGTIAQELFNKPHRVFVCPPHAICENDAVLSCKPSSLWVPYSPDKSADAATSCVLSKPARSKIAAVTHLLVEWSWPKQCKDQFGIETPAVVDFEDTEWFSYNAVIQALTGQDVLSAAELMDAAPGLLSLRLEEQWPDVDDDNGSSSPELFVRLLPNHPSHLPWRCQCVSAASRSIELCIGHVAYAFNCFIVSPIQFVCHVFLGVVLHDPLQNTFFLVVSFALGRLIWWLRKKHVLKQQLKQVNEEASGFYEKAKRILQGYKYPRSPLKVLVLRDELAGDHQDRSHFIENVWPQVLTSLQRDHRIKLLMIEGGEAEAMAWDGPVYS